MCLFVCVYIQDTHNFKHISSLSCYWVWPDGTWIACERYRIWPLPKAVSPPPPLNPARWKRPNQVCSFVGKLQVSPGQTLPLRVTITGSSFSPSRTLNTTIVSLSHTHTHTHTHKHTLSLSQIAPPFLRGPAPHPVSLSEMRQLRRLHLNVSIQLPGRRNGRPHQTGPSQCHTPNQNKKGRNNPERTISEYRAGYRVWASWLIFGSHVLPVKFGPTLPTRTDKHLKKTFVFLSGLPHCLCNLTAGWTSFMHKSQRRCTIHLN